MSVQLVTIDDVDAVASVRGAVASRPVAGGLVPQCCWVTGQGFFLHSEPSVSPMSLCAGKMPPPILFYHVLAACVSRAVFYQST